MLARGWQRSSERWVEGGGEAPPLPSQTSLSPGLSPPAVRRAAHLSLEASVLQETDTALCLQTCTEPEA